MQTITNESNIVNANIGITNIIEKDEIRSTMMNTFIELANKLKAHCGPYSGTAILADPNNVLAEPVFTKDGINIVKSIKYMSPMQDFVRIQLAYMGARVERSAGDGTTSTMIIMAYTLASLIEYFNNTKYIYSNIDLSNTWNLLVTKLVEKYKKYVDFAKQLNDQDTIKYIAASQAYTSSHGDKALAECIGQLFSNTPRVVWDTLTINKAVYETEEKYKVDITESEYSLDKVRLFPLDKCNEELGTVLDWKDTDVILQDIVAVGDDYQKAFHTNLEERIKNGTRTIVICNDTMDSATVNHYSELFRSNPDHQTVFVMVPAEDASLNDVAALSVLVYQRGDMGKQDDINTFKADVHFEGSLFRFTKGLFKCDKPASGISPYYENPDYKEFNEFITHVKTIINREKLDVTRSTDRSIKCFTRILHKLLTTKYVTFTVGGAAYDNAAAQDIAIDALLATKCSLTKGFAAGRFVTLRSLLKELLEDGVGDTVLPKISVLYTHYIKSLLHGIDEIDKALEDNVGCSENIKRALEYKDSPVDFIRLDDPSYVIPKSLQDAISSKTDYCILQPVETDVTFLRRFGELGLKFLTANRVITAGYLYEAKDKEG